MGKNNYMNINVLNLNYKLLWIIITVFPIIMSFNSIYFLVGSIVILDLLLRLINNNRIDFLFFKRNLPLVVFVIYSFIILVCTGIDFYSLKRFFTFMFYFYFAYLTSYYEKKSKEDILIYVLKLLIFILIISNVLNHNFSLTLSFEKIRALRYHGLLGINYHAFISALAAMLGFYINNSNKKLIIFYSLFNLFISGSRASILSFIIFFICYIFFKNIDKRHLFLPKILLFLFGGIMIILLFLLNINRELRLYFELTEHSINGRLFPIIYSLKMIRENNLLPYGLGSKIIDSVMNNGPLDNSFLILFIELGIFGVIIFGYYLLKKMFIFYKFNLSIKRFYKEKNKISCLISIFIAILFESFFENMLFNSIKIGTFILFIIIVKLDRLMEE